MRVRRQRTAHRIFFLSHDPLYGGAGLLHYPLLEAEVSQPGQEGPGAQGVGATAEGTQ